MSFDEITPSLSLTKVIDDVEIHVTKHGNNRNFTKKEELKWAYSRDRKIRFLVTLNEPAVVEHWSFNEEGIKKSLEKNDKRND